ncbi:MAG: hypothetical protein AAB907_04435, partial [Patescibacteria group bacterium]
FEVIRNYINGEEWPVILVGSGRDKSYLHDGFTHWAEDAKMFLDCFSNIQQFWPEEKENVNSELLGEILKNGKPAFVSLKR